MKKLLPFLVIFGIILVSGCTGQGTSGGGGSQGIIIESFGTTYSKLEPGETFEITARIKNVGGAEVTNIRPEIYGLGEWNLRMITPPISSLKPPDPSRNIEGEETEIVWEAQAPSYKTGIDDYQFELRVYYIYSTSAEAQIRVATDKYIKSFPPDQQEAKINELGVRMEKTTSGPIDVNIDAPNKVIRSGSNEIRVTINIQNLGGGSITNNEIPISISSSTNIDCGPIGNVVKLIGGKSKQIRCSIFPSLTQGWDTIKLSVNIGPYEYWVNSFASISVLPEEV